MPFFQPERRLHAPVREAVVLGEVSAERHPHDHPVRGHVLDPRPHQHAEGLRIQHALRERDRLRPLQRGHRYTRITVSAVAAGFSLPSNSMVLATVSWA